MFAKRPHLTHAGLECPVCFQVRRDTKIYICVNGHDVCGICKTATAGDTAGDAITRCPTCRGSYPVPAIRNLRLEHLIEESNLEFSCANEAEGCQYRGVVALLKGHELSYCDHRLLPCTVEGCVEKVKARDLGQHTEFDHQECKYSADGCKFVAAKRVLVGKHEMGCEHRKVPCPTGWCGKHVKFAHILDHMKQKHTEIFKSNCTLTTCLQKDEWLLPTCKQLVNWARSFNFEGQTFVRRLYRSTETVYYAWVKIVGNQKAADSFTVVIKAFGNKAEFNKECKVHAIDTADELIRADIDCFQLSLNQARQFLDRDLALVYKEDGYTSKLPSDFMLKKK